MTLDVLLGAAELETARALLLEGADADRLYAAWFHRDTGSWQGWPEAGAYRSAMLDADRYEGGWRVVGTAAGAAGAVEIERAGERRALAPPQVAPATMRDLGFGPGAMAWADPLDGRADGGFWHIWSGRWRAAAPAALQRVYVPLGPAGALAFARVLSRHLPPDGLWAAKALMGPQSAGRRDSALLYLPADVRLSEGWLVALLGRVAPLAEGPLPPLVQALERGLGWARDPGDGRSFGQAAAFSLWSAREEAGDATRFRAAAAQAVAPLIGTPR